MNRSRGRRYSNGNSNGQSRGRSNNRRGYQDARRNDNDNSRYQEIPEPVHEIRYTFNDISIDESIQKLSHEIAAEVMAKSKLLVENKVKEPIYGDLTRYPVNGPPLTADDTKHIFNTVELLNNLSGLSHEDIQSIYERYKNRLNKGQIVLYDSMVVLRLTENFDDKIIDYYTLRDDFVKNPDIINATLIANAKLKIDEIKLQMATIFARLALIDHDDLCHKERSFYKYIVKLYAENQLYLSTVESYEISKIE